MESIAPMRVLWFVNTPSGAASLLDAKVVGGGWIESLEEQIAASPRVSLGVAFTHGKQRRDKLTREGTTYYPIPETGSRWKIWWDRHRVELRDEALLRECISIIDDFHPDIIHVFGSERGFGLLSGRVKVPVVIHLQGIMTVCFKKWLPAGIRPATLTRASGPKKLLKADSLLHAYRQFGAAARREAVIFRHCNHVMGRTDWDRRVASVMAPGARYYHCEEVIRKEFYQAAWQKQPGAGKVLLSTIQPTFFKGLETVLETARLLDGLGAFPFTWLVAGASPGDLAVKVFEEQVGARFADHHVRLLGRIPAEELIAQELGADVFVHPSHIDNSSNSVCEAMLLGMPVIATFTGGTGSLLDDRSEGLLIQDGDPYALAGAALELFRDPERAAALGRKARERALRRHDPRAITASVLDTYTEILSKRPI